MESSKVGTGEASIVPTPTAGINRGLSILDVILRFVAIAATLAAAVAMATSKQQLQFFTQVSFFNIQYQDFSSLRYFVATNAIACAYFTLSIPLAILLIARSTAKPSRVLLIIMDMVMLGLLTSAASSATTIVFLAHNGNDSANWNSICNQFTNFCSKASASLIGSFAAIVILMLLIIMSTAVLARS